MTHAHAHSKGSSLENVSDALHHAAHYLPAQGPISTFIHHNSLHAFEHLSFHEGIASAQRVLGIRGYFPLARYRALFQQGRIEARDLVTSSIRFAGDLPEGKGLLIDPKALLHIALHHEIPRMTAASTAFAIDALGALEHFADDVSPDMRTRAAGDKKGDAEALRALHAECTKLPFDGDIARRSFQTGPFHLPVAMVRAGASDAAALVHPVVIRLAASYIDEGLARTEWPGRNAGFLASFRQLVLETPSFLPAWQRGLPDRVREDLGCTAEEIIDRCLHEFAILPDDYPEAIHALLARIPGWAGMFHRLETHPEDRDPGAPPCALADLVAVLLTYKVLACRFIAKDELRFSGLLAELSLQLRQNEAAHAARDFGPDALWTLFLLCQYAGVSAAALSTYDQTSRVRTVLAFREIEARTAPRVFHEAYEERYYRDVLSAIAENRARGADDVAPVAQVLCCIDDREESLRRAIEETDPRVETFGTAGFFGLPIAFRGFEDSRAAAQCPVVLQPAQIVVETPEEEHRHIEGTHRARLGWWAAAERAILRGSRSLSTGTLLTPAVGFAAAAQFGWRILFPRAASSVGKAARKAFAPRPKTRLKFEGDGAIASSVEDRATRVYAALTGMGLTKAFAPVVVVLGHGSSSVNNPHASAYDCGACGGRHGGANARLFAEIANDPAVRAALRTRGLAIPDETFFVGGAHDTATDGIELFDTDRIPSSARPAFDRIVDVLEKARGLSAHERCRRFEHAPTRITPEKALRHVEARTADLGQARPELGHATNAACVIGRRILTRGLFLDRRALLVSYDPTIDDADGKILERNIGAAGPVCAGINLEYYFSCVDNDRLGGGTKLPHNVVALLGVMDGTDGDLRTGLPTQMIEIHEPVRLLTVVETDETAFRAVLRRHETVRNLVEKEWIRIAIVDPTTAAISVYRDGVFEPFDERAADLPRVRHSMDWYQGHADFLRPAFVTSSFAS